MIPSSDDKCQMSALTSNVRFLFVDSLSHVGLWGHASTQIANSAMQIVFPFYYFCSSQ